jgi:hypothetical protein
MFRAWRKITTKGFKQPLMWVSPNEDLPPRSTYRTSASMVEDANIDTIDLDCSLQAFAFRENRLLSSYGDEYQKMLEQTMLSLISRNRTEWLDLRFDTWEAMYTIRGIPGAIFTLCIDEKASEFITQELLEGFRGIEGFVEVGGMNAWEIDAEPCFSYRWGDVIIYLPDEYAGNSVVDRNTGLEIATRGYRTIKPRFKPSLFEGPETETMFGKLLREAQERKDTE